MKRFHVHVAVSDIDQSVRFYSTLFASEPAVRKSDYAKWMLDDPHVNFAISKRGAEAGLRHLRIHAQDSGERQAVANPQASPTRLNRAAVHEYLAAYRDPSSRNSS